MYAHLLRFTSHRHPTALRYRYRPPERRQAEREASEGLGHPDDRIRPSSHRACDRVDLRSTGARLGAASRQERPASRAAEDARDRPHTAAMSRVRPAIESTPPSRVHPTAASTPPGASNDEASPTSARKTPSRPAGVYVAPHQKAAAAKRAEEERFLRSVASAPSCYGAPIRCFRRLRAEHEAEREAERERHKRTAIAMVQRKQELTMRFIPVAHGCCVRLRGAAWPSNLFGLIRFSWNGLQSQ